MRYVQTITPKPHNPQTREVDVCEQEMPDGRTITRYLAYVILDPDGDRVRHLESDHEPPDLSSAHAWVNGE